MHGGRASGGPSHLRPPLLSTCLRVHFNDSWVWRKADGRGWSKSVGAKCLSALDRRAAVVAAAAAAYAISQSAEARIGNAMNIPYAHAFQAKSVPGICS